MPFVLIFSWRCDLEEEKCKSHSSENIPNFGCNVLDKLCPLFISSRISFFHHKTSPFLSSLPKKKKARFKLLKTPNIRKIFSTIIFHILSKMRHFMLLNMTEPHLLKVITSPDFQFWKIISLLISFSFTNKLKIITLLWWIRRTGLKMRSERKRWRGLLN